MAAKKKNKKSSESAFDLMLARLKTVGVFSAAALIAGGITWAIKSEVVERTAEKVADTMVAAKDDLTTSAGMILEEVLVTGRKHSNAQNLLTALGVYEDMPVLALDIDEAKKKAEQLPWVKNVHIERRLPGTVFIAITEYEPVAILQNNGEFVLIDVDGNAVNGISVDGFSELPIVVGSGAAANVQNFLDVVRSEESLQDRVKAAVRVGNRRWDIIMDDVQKGIVVSLPEENAVDAWKHLALFNRVHGILNKKLSLLDLRIKGKFIIRMADGSDNGELRSIAYSAEQDI